MKKLILTLMLTLCAPVFCHSAQTTLDEAVDATKVDDGGTTGADWRNTTFDNFADQNLMNTDIYLQAATKWETGQTYTEDVNVVVHGASVYVCTTTHIASAAGVAGTEPGVGGNWDTVWEVFGGSLYEALKGADDNYVTDAQVLLIDDIAGKQDSDALLTDISNITGVQGDIFYFDGTDIVQLNAGTEGQFLETQGAGADPVWGDPVGSGDITAVGDGTSGAIFTADGGGNVLYFEGTTANAYEIALTGGNPGADAVLTLPTSTDTLVGRATTDTLTNKDLSSGNTFPTFNQDTTGTAATATTATTANSGDSATAFFSTGTIEEARLPDLSATYEPADAAIAKTDENETLTGNWVNTTNPWVVNEGGTGAATFTAGGLIYGSGTGALTSGTAGLDTQVLVGGGTGVDPYFSTSLPGGVTLGGQYIYRSGGTDVADADVTDNLTVAAQAGSTWSVTDSVAITSVYANTTSLDESTSATDSGAYIIGVFDDFTNSDSSNIQGVLKQFDTAISGGGSTLGDVLTTSPLLVNGGANLNDILPGVDADVTLSMPVADTTNSGYLSTTDWDTFNDKVGGPSSSTDNTIAIFDSTTGKLIQEATGCTISSGVITCTGGFISGAADTYRGLTLNENTADTNIDNQTIHYTANSLEWKNESGTDQVFLFVGDEIADGDIPDAIARDSELPSGDFDTEAEIEAAVDLEDLQGAVTDSQVPNDITITESDPSVDTSDEIVDIVNTSPDSLIADAVIAGTIARDSELLTVISGTSTLGTASIASGACATTVTTTATGAATTDVISGNFNSSPLAVTGYAASADGSLHIYAWPTSNNVNFSVCNNTADAITPGARTLNWQIIK